MSWPARDACSRMVAVCNRLGFPFDLRVVRSQIVSQRNTDVLISRFRSRGHDLVQDPLEKSGLTEQECRDVGTGRMRSADFCTDVHRHLPGKHGRPRGNVAQGEARQELRRHPADELDDLALRADGQLQICASSAPRPGRQCRLHRLELVLEHGQREVREPSLDDTMKIGVLQE